MKANNAFSLWPSHFMLPLRVSRDVYKRCLSRYSPKIIKY